MKSESESILVNGICFACQGLPVIMGVMVISDFINLYYTMIYLECVKEKKIVK